MSKKLKNIGIDPDTTGKSLKKQAIDANYNSYQEYCEDILEHQGKNNTIKLGGSKAVKKKTIKIEPPITEDNAKDTDIVIQPESSSQKEVKAVVKSVDNTITKDEKKGAFARSSSNIYTNGKVWEYRRMVPNIGLTSHYYRTKAEADNAKAKEDATKI